MANILILNPTTENVGIALKNGPTTQLTNLGPPGSVNIDAEESNICLAPQSTIKSAEVYKSKAIDLEGKYVIEAGAKIIPFIFEAKDLASYFNEEDLNETGIAFVPVGNIPEISCTDAVNATKEMILNGQFGLRVNGLTLGNESNTLVEIQTLLAAQGVEMTITAEPARPGTTILKSTTEVGASVWVNLNATREVEIDWGDGAVDVVPAGTNGSVEHVYINGLNNEIRLFTPSVGQVYTITGAVDELVDFGVGNPLFGSTTFSPGECAIQKVPVTLPSHVKSIRFARCPLFNDPNVVDWDVSKLTSVEGAFQEATSFNQPIGNWKLTLITSLRSFLDGASAFNQNLNDLDVSKITDLINTFSRAVVYNQPMNKWDVSKVVNFTNLFSGARRFNQDLNDWVTSSALYLSSAFQDAVAYNQPMNKWDVSKAFAFTGMFFGATNFSQDLSGWCVSLVATQPTNFSNRSALTNAQLPVWGTCPSGRERLVTFKSNGTGLLEIASIYGTEGLPASIIDSNNKEVAVADPFHQITLPAGTYTLEYTKQAYSGPTENITVAVTGPGLTEFVEFSTFKIGTFMTGGDGTSLANLVKVPATAPNVVDLVMHSFFKGATKFNDPNVARWNVTGVASFESCFEGCTAFNQNLNEWDVSSGVFFASMFKGCSNYNQPMIDWKVDNGVDFESMFQGCSVFNRDISTWNMENATKLTNFINGAVTFNQNLSRWCMSGVTSQPAGWTGLALSPSNFPVWGTCPRGESPVLPQSTVVVFDTSKAFGSDVITALSTGQVEVVWTDGTKAVIPANVEDSVSLPTWMTEKPGLYQVSINSVSATELYISAPLTKVLKWSDNGYSVLSLQSAFLTTVPNTKPTGLTDLSILFADATIFNDPNVKVWDVKDATMFTGMFQNAAAFNQDISGWDVEKVNSMNQMFRGATSFNQDLSQWCVLNITEEPNQFNTDGIISPANLPVWGSCPSKVHVPTENATVIRVETNQNGSSVNSTFQFTSPSEAIIYWPNGSRRVISPNVTLTFDLPSFSNFDQTSYDVCIEHTEKASLVVTGAAVIGVKQWSAAGYSKLSLLNCTELTTVPATEPPLLINYSELFDGCKKLNDSNISTWNVLNVTNFLRCFKDCTLFNQDISIWSMDNATNVIEMLMGATVFNQDLSQWCTTNVLPSNRTDFSTDSLLTDEQLPVWGTCPRGKAPFDEDSMVLVLDTTKPSGTEFIKIRSSEPSTIVWAEGQPVTNVAANFDGAFGLPQFMIDAPGQYQISINCEAVAGVQISSPLTEVKQWAGYGFNRLELTSSALVKVPNTKPTGLTDFTNLFAGASILNDSNIVDWIVDDVTKYDYTFQQASKFNQPLTSWVVEAASSMTGMFDNATDFDQDLSQWCVSNVTTLPSNFNRNGKLATGHFPVWGTCPGKVIPTTQDDTILTFDTTGSSGNAGSLMFNNTADATIIWPNGAETNLADVTPSGSLYIVPLNAYVVNNPGPQRVIIRQRGVISYYNASNYLIEVNQWSRFGYNNFRVMSTRATTVPNTAPPNLINYTQIFKDCSVLNTSNVSAWNTSNVLTMDSAFENASAFNQDISGWDVSKVVSMNNFLRNASTFSQDLSGWCVGQILSEPVNFADGSGMFGPTYPVWGTCPSDPTKLEILVDDEIEIGSTTQAIAVTTPELVQTSISWLSQSPEIATINSEGIITAVAVGVARIHCLYNNKLGAFINVNIVEVPPPVVNKDPVVKFKGNSTDPVTVSVTGTDAKWELLNAAGDVIQADTVTEPYVGILDGEFELRVSTPDTSGLNVLVAGPGLTDILSYPLQSFNSVSHFDSSAISTNLVNVPALAPSVVSMFGMFRGASSFNSPNLSMWSVKQVENMGRMLDECSAFNQDLSTWCVSNFSEAPPVFNGQGQLTAAQMPVWGTCPRVNPAVGRESTSLVLNSINFAAANSTQIIITTDTQVDVVWGDGSKTTSKSTDGTVQSFTVRVPDYIKNERGEHYFVVNNTLPCGLQLIGDGITKVLKWSETGYTKVQLGTSQLTNVPATAPPKVTDFSNIFNGCNSLNDPNIAEWDVSKVTAFNNAFVNAYAFNQDIGKWNVSATKNSDAMNSMLANTMALSQDLSKWCVTNVTVKPLDFNEGSALTNEQLPVWGTCPVR